MKKLCLAAFVVSLGVACTPAAAAYTSIFAFGDSLSDAGNLFSEDGGIAPVPPYVDGHFSNGPTWVEDLSQMLGLGPMKPFLTSNDGTNYAFGGAQTGTTDINPPNPSSPIHIDLPDQINAYDLLNPAPVKGALSPGRVWPGRHSHGQDCQTMSSSPNCRPGSTASSYSVA